MSAREQRAVALAPPKRTTAFSKHPGAVVVIVLGCAGSLAFMVLASMRSSRDDPVRASDAHGQLAPSVDSRGPSAGSQASRRSMPTEARAVPDSSERAAPSSVSEVRMPSALTSWTLEQKDGPPERERFPQDRALLDD